MLKKEVLRNQKNFNACYNKGKSCRDRFVVLFYKKNNLDYNRIGVIASKKVGNAVKRNRARRLIKESIRLLNPLDFTGYDLIFVARTSILDFKQGDVMKSIKNALYRSKLTRDKK